MIWTICYMNIPSLELRLPFYPSYSLNIPSQDKIMHFKLGKIREQEIRGVRWVWGRGGCYHLRENYFQSFPGIGLIITSQEKDHNVQASTSGSEQSVSILVHFQVKSIIFSFFSVWNRQLDTHRNWNWGQLWGWLLLREWLLSRHEDGSEVKPPDVLHLLPDVFRIPKPQGSKSIKVSIPKTLNIPDEYLQL